MQRRLCLTTILFLAAEQALADRQDVRASAKIGEDWSNGWTDVGSD